MKLTQYDTLGNITVTGPCLITAYSPEYDGDLVGLVDALVEELALGVEVDRLIKLGPAYGDPWVRDVELVLTFMDCPVLVPATGRWQLRKIDIQEAYAADHEAESAYDWS